MTRNGSHGYSWIGTDHASKTSVKISVNPWVVKRTIRNDQEHSIFRSYTRTAQLSRQWIFRSKTLSEGTRRTRQFKKFDDLHNGLVGSRWKLAGAAAKMVTTMCLRASKQRWMWLIRSFLIESDHTPRFWNRQSLTLAFLSFQRAPGFPPTWAFSPLRGAPRVRIPLASSAPLVWVVLPSRDRRRLDDRLPIPAHRDVCSRLRVFDEHWPPMRRPPGRVRDRGSRRVIVSYGTGSGLGSHRNTDSVDQPTRLPVR